jgi:molybdate transport system substrate-binding protein
MAKQTIGPALFLATVMVIGMHAAVADEIKVMASGATKEAYLELVPSFEKATGHKVTTIWDGTANITQRIGDGEVVDLVITASPTIDKLTSTGKLVSGSKTEIAKSGVGVAVRAGLPKPDISSGEALKQAVLAAKSVVYSSGPSGLYLAELFRKMGIADQIRDKVKQTPPGTVVGEVVARGEADLGFQQVSELLHVKGIDYLGPLPPDIQHITVFSAALHKAATAPDAAIAVPHRARGGGDHSQDRDGARLIAAADEQRFCC